MKKAASGSPAKPVGLPPSKPGQKAFAGLKSLPAHQSQHDIPLKERKRRDSLDQQQRLVKKAKEITYLGQLGKEMDKGEHKERASSIAKDYSEQRTRNDSVVRDGLKKQDEAFKERLRERQQRSFNRSLQKQGSFCPSTKGEDGEGENTEQTSQTDLNNILGGLDSNPLSES